MRAHRIFLLLSTAALFLCLVVVVLGAYVRLSDAGLGCPDWPGCYGHFDVPEESHEIARANEAYPERPVEAHKAWKEMAHRYAASTLGFIILILFFMSLVRRYALPRILPRVLLALVIFQGMLGMWTVTLLLKPIVVTGHLLGGMTTLALLTWLWCSTLTTAPEPSWARDPKLQKSNRRLKIFSGFALAALAAQIFVGGWTSTNYAALACPDFPTCQNQLWPDMDVKEAYTLWRGLGVNYEFGVLDNRQRVTIHFIHRLGAIAITLIIGLLAILLMRRKSAMKYYGAALAVALGAQIAIGISIVMLQLPLALATAHNAGAAILLMTLVATTFQIRKL